MEQMTRRSFIGKSLALGAGLSGLQLAGNPTQSSAVLRTVKDDISIAQWALVKEIREGKWTTEDFPRICRELFDVNGCEFVNSLFTSPYQHYLDRIKRNAADHNVKLVLIMVDDEGETAAPSKQERKQTVINHRKWIDIAAYLGCHAIRTNCRGPKDASKADTLDWASETYNMMLEYAIPQKISICIENHGGISNDPDWMVQLFERVNNLYFGSYPDWRGPSDRFDNFEYVRKMVPYAHGMSARNQPSYEETKKLVDICRDGGYRGWYGIETSGREGIKATKAALNKALWGKT